MAIVQFKTLTKYNGRFYPAFTDVEVAEGDIATLATDGLLVLNSDKVLAETSKTVDNIAVDEVKPEKPVEWRLMQMTLKDLANYAIDNGYDISGLRKKPDITSAILKQYEDKYAELV